MYLANWVTKLSHSGGETGSTAQPQVPEDIRRYLQWASSPLGASPQHRGGLLHLLDTVVDDTKKQNLLEATRSSLTPKAKGDEKYYRTGNGNLPNQAVDLWYGVT